MARFTPADRLIGATDFSGDPEVNSPVWLIKTIKHTQWVYRPLKQAVDNLEANWGRGREPGEWALVYLAFITSKVPDIQPWHARTSDDIWRAAGFTGRPPYSRVWARFTELEDVMLAFREAAGRLIRHARKHDARVGAHVHWDSTEAETHAALVHVCCKPKRGTGRRSKLGQRPQRETTQAVRGLRQEAVDQEPAPDRPKPELGEIEKVRMRNGHKEVLINKHWYRTLDNTAGIRAYKGNRGAIKFWHGFYNQKAVDHFTGGTLAVDDFNASTNEHIYYPELYAQLVDNTGAHPESSIADRGFSLASVFEQNSCNGVASVIPWRAHGNTRERRDFETHDRHGIPRCRHCGAATRFVRFSVNGGHPRMWAQCSLQLATGCAGEQTFSCSNDYRLLLPLWRTDVLYHQLQQSHNSYERAHDDWRERYLVAGDNRSIRPKRRGVAWQRLRSARPCLSSGSAFAIARTGLVRPDRSVVTTVR